MLIHAASVGHLEMRIITAVSTQVPAVLTHVGHRELLQAVAVYVTDRPGDQFPHRHAALGVFVLQGRVPVKLVGGDERPRLAVREGPVPIDHDDVTLPVAANLSASTVGHLVAHCRAEGDHREEDPGFAINAVRELQASRFHRKHVVVPLQAIRSRGRRGRREGVVPTLPPAIPRRAVPETAELNVFPDGPAHDGR